MIYGDWIGRWGKSDPDKIALIDYVEGKRYTYRQLSDRIYRMANFLMDGLGIKKGDRITCLSHNRIEYIDLFFAAGRIGAILVPLNVRLALNEFLYLLKDCEPRAFFFSKEYAEIIEGLRNSILTEIYVNMDDFPNRFIILPIEIKKYPGTPPEEVDIQAKDPHMIIYTSGTTGLPKGVILTHGMITWNSINTIIGWELSSHDISVIVSPMFYTAGWNVFTLPLFHCRGTNILVEGFDADLILEIIEKEQVTLFFGVPTMFKMMIDSPKFKKTDFSSVRFLVSGGAPCPKDYFDIFMQEKGIRLWEGYGLTEVGPNNFLANGKIGTFGHPMFHVDIKLVDDEGRDVRPGEIGEIIIRGEHICGGYWNNPKATDEAIRNGWFYTGDLGKVDEDGHFSIVGRKKDMIISGGANIYPAEIEKVISKHHKVAEVAVIGLPDPKWGEVPKAIIVPIKGEILTAEEIFDFCKDKIGKWKIPKYIAFTDVLPRTASSNKVQKFILKEKFGKPE
jgi:fatty-acyl-CoA synthase